jgi:hypothetical protein
MGAGRASEDGMTACRSILGYMEDYTFCICSSILTSMSQLYKPLRQHCGGGAVDDKLDIETLIAALPSKLRGHVTTMSPGELAVAAFIASPEGVARMEDECRKGMPPVVALSGLLVERLGPDVRDMNVVKQRIGRIVRFTLEGAGWQFTGSRPIRNDLVFASGAVYRRLPGAPVTGSITAPMANGSHGLLRRFVASLTAAEIAALKTIIEEVEGEHT